MAPLSGVCSSPEWQASVTSLELNAIKCTALQGISCLSLYVLMDQRVGSHLTGPKPQIWQQAGSQDGGIHQELTLTSEG